MSRKTIIKVAITHVLALPLAYILTEVTLGVTCGLVGGLKMRGDESLHRDVREVLGPVDESEEPRDVWSRLSPEKQKLLKDRVTRVVQSIDWFGPTLFASAFVFAIVGFACGFITRSFYLVGLVPAATFLLNNPTIRFAMARDLSPGRKVLVVVFAQFGICYLAAYGGAVLARRRDKKRKPSQATGGPDAGKPEGEEAGNGVERDS